MLNVHGSGESRTCPERESKSANHNFAIEHLGLECDHKTFAGLACAGSGTHGSKKFRAHRSDSSKFRLMT